jgi:hypothetical protein
MKLTPIVIAILMFAARATDEKWFDDDICTKEELQNPPNRVDTCYGG